MPIRPDRAGREGGCMKLYRLRLLPLAAALLLAACSGPDAAGEQQRPHRRRDGGRLHRAHAAAHHPSHDPSHRLPGSGNRRHL